MLVDLSSASSVLFFRTKPFKKHCRERWKYYMKQSSALFQAIKLQQRQVRFGPHPLIISFDKASVFWTLKIAMMAACAAVHLFLGDKLWKITRKPTVISQTPLWLLLGNQLIPAQEGLDAEQIENLSKASRVNIPAAEKEALSENYLPGLASQFTITGQGILTNESLKAQATPVSRREPGCFGCLAEVRLWRFRGPI
jgi:hypothetical protein